MPREEAAKAAWARGWLMPDVILIWHGNVLKMSAPPGLKIQISEPLQFGISFSIMNLMLSSRVWPQSSAIQNIIFTTSMMSVATLL